MNDDKNKKYGVIFSPTKNIGDDFQTLAAINFLEKKGIKNYEVLNREGLKNYDGEEINLIMNGWWMERVKNFPPSSKINPVWISFHVSRPDLITNCKNYFKKQPPIGCRDQATVDLFQKNGIDAYFTGCLTLFFDKYNGVKNKKKYMVDLTDVGYIGDVHIDVNKLVDFENVKHDVFKKKNHDIRGRLNLASQYLDRYKKAQTVITTRLHCALPCRAFGTNCVFVHKNYNSDPRFKGLEGVLNGDVQYHTNNIAKTDSVEKIKDFFNKFEL